MARGIIRHSQQAEMGQPWRLGLHWEYDKPPVPTVTAGQSGDLPPNLRMEYDVPPNARKGSGRVMAFDDDNPDPWYQKFGVGELSWTPEGKVAWVQTRDPYLRRGVGTAMWEHAKKIRPDIHHSEEQSPSAKQWAPRAAAVPEQAPKRSFEDLLRQTREQRYKGGPAHVYRGMRISLPPGEQPNEANVAKAMRRNFDEHTGEFTDREGLGQHWSTNPDIAHEFAAATNILDDIEPEGNHHQVMIEADYDGKGWQPLPPGQFGYEREVRLPPGTPISVTSIKTRPHKVDGQRQRMHQGTPWTPLVTGPRTMTAAATLRGPLRFEHAYTPYQYGPGSDIMYDLVPDRYPVGYHDVKAYDGNDLVGSLHWDNARRGPKYNPPNNELGWITTHPDYRRQGVATQMMTWAQKNADPLLSHSHSLTDEGAAFAKSFGVQPENYVHQPPVDDTQDWPDAQSGHGEKWQGKGWNTDWYKKDIQRLRPTAALADTAPGLPEGYRIVTGPHSATIQGPDGQYAGSMQWMPREGEVKFIHVAPEHRMHGLATALFNHVKKIHPELHHSNDLTDAGREWTHTMYDFEPKAASARLPNDGKAWATTTANWNPGRVSPEVGVV